MTCIIVDDEPLAREDLQYLIETCSTIKVLQTFPNAMKPMDFLRTNQVDIVFLDIEMPKFNGLEFADQISEHKDYLGRWIKQCNLLYPLDELWRIREECITALRWKGLYLDSNDIGCGVCTVGIYSVIVFYSDIIR